MSLAEHFNESSFQEGDLLSGQVKPRGGKGWTQNYFHKLASRVFQQIVGGSGPYFVWNGNCLTAYFIRWFTCVPFYF